MTDYTTIDADNYDAMPGVRPSRLKVLALQSPAHYHAAESSPIEETPGMRLGTAAHRLIQQPELFRDVQYAIKPEGMSFTTLEGKAWKKTHAGREILTAEQFAAVQGMAAAIAAHSDASTILRPGVGYIERPVAWVDSDTGLLCKGKPDLVTFDGWVDDLKTTADASPRAFGAQSARLGYHFSAAMYDDGLIANGEAVRGNRLIVVETTPPYVVQVYRIPDRAIERGRERYKAALRTLAECLRANEWPGYSNEIMDLELPRWEFGQDPELAYEHAVGAFADELAAMAAK